jgi:hypothetical protein
MTYLYLFIMFEIFILMLMTSNVAVGLYAIFL